MMMRLKQFLLYFGLAFVLFLTLIIMLPKQALWYELEDSLLSKKVIFDGEKIEEKWFSLEINEANVYMGSLNIARISSMGLTTLGFYNSLSLKNLLVGSDLKMLRGLHIAEADISYIPFTDVVLRAKGNFGSLEGSIDLSKGTYVLEIQASAWLKKQYLVMKMLKKTKKGFSYVGHF